MAGLRSDIKSMRDLPQEPQTSSFSKYVDSLPEERGFMEKLTGQVGLDPGSPNDQRKLLSNLDAIRTGQLNEDQVKKLMRRNKLSAGLYASAFDEYKKASTLQGTEKGIIARYFGTQEQFGPTRPGETLLPVQKANYGQAIPELIGAGLTESAGKLSTIEKQMRETSGGPDPSAVKEWNFYNALPKADQARFLELKRQGYRIADIGGVPSMAPTVTGLPVIPLSTLSGEVTGKSAIEGGKKAAEVKAGAQAQAQVDLGSNLDEINKMREGVSGLVNSKGFDTIYGLSGKISPSVYIPGTEASNSEARRAQLEAATFEISIQKMKGLGQLSDAEGKKVTAAYTRAINTKQSAPAARQAWAEVQRYLDLAEKRANQKAGQEPTAKQPTLPGGFVYKGSRTK